MIKKLASIGVVGLVFSLVAVFALTSTSEAKRYTTDDHKIVICHADNNVNKPYGPKAIEVDYDAVDGQGGSDHSSHTGPVPASIAEAQALKDAKTDWGDIIPPVEGVTAGLNWTALGQAIWNNDCQYPEVASAAVTKTAATCDEGQKLVYGAISNATFSGTANGTEGPANYSVTATADSNALFAGQQTTQTFTGTLGGKLVGEQCDTPDGETVRATASVTIVPATCESAASISYSDNTISHASWSGTPSGTAGGDYKVVATAEQGAEFADGMTVKVFEGTLDPIVTDDCVLGEDTDDPTPTDNPKGEGEVLPATLPETGASTPVMLAAILAGLVALLAYGGATLRRVLARNI